MTEDVEALKGLALRNPVRQLVLGSWAGPNHSTQVILKLEEDEDEAANLTQYSVR